MSPIRTLWDIMNIFIFEDGSRLVNNITLLYSFFKGKKHILISVYTFLNGLHVVVFHIQHSHITRKLNAIVPLSHHKQCIRSGKHACYLAPITFANPCEFLCLCIPTTLANYSLRIVLWYIRARRPRHLQYHWRQHCEHINAQCGTFMLFTSIYKFIVLTYLTISKCLVKSPTRATVSACYFEILCKGIIFKNTANLQ